MAFVSTSSRSLLRAPFFFSACWRNISSSSQKLSGLLFTEKHEWIKVDSTCSVGTVGISKYAEQKLGDIVFVELPGKGDNVQAHEQCGIVESVKAVSEIYSPASGKVIELNSALDENTSIVNKSPMDDGWLFKVSLDNPDELKQLMSEEKYKEFLESEH